MPDSNRTWPALDMAGDFQTATADLLQAALTDFHVAAIEETASDFWRLYFHEAAERDRALATLHRDFPTLQLTPADVADEDWAARSQAELRRIQVGQIIVAPPWDVPLVITIQPSMGFGTGHHATTRLCLAALQASELRGKTVLDAGTGSAVLAIAASLLGASDVTGIDDDEDAIHAAWENLALNPGASVTLLVGDMRSTELVPADVVVANLTGGLLMAASDRLQRLVTAGGRLILSGFQRHEERAVREAFPAWPEAWRGEEEDWVCLTLGAPEGARRHR